LAFDEGISPTSERDTGRGEGEKLNSGGLINSELGLMLQSNAGDLGLLSGKQRSAHDKLHPPFWNKTTGQMQRV
jgi:hypothetical protein